MKGQKRMVFINGKRTNHNEMFSRKLSTFCQSLCQRQAVPRFTCLAFFSPTFSTFLYNQQSFPNPTLNMWCSFLASLHILHISLQSFLNPTLNAQCFFTSVMFPDNEKDISLCNLHRRPCCWISLRSFVWNVSFKISRQI